MSEVLTDARLGEIAFALLFCEVDMVAPKQLPEALQDLEVELVSLRICTEEEASAVCKKMQAMRFERQFPTAVLENVALMRRQGR
jgi:hypothetical protein